MVLRQIKAVMNEHNKGNPYFCQQGRWTESQMESAYTWMSIIENFYSVRKKVESQNVFWVKLWPAHICVWERLTPATKARQTEGGNYICGNSLEDHCDDPKKSYCDYNGREVRMADTTQASAVVETGRLSEWLNIGGGQEVGQMFGLLPWAARWIVMSEIRNIGNGQCGKMGSDRGEDHVQFGTPVSLNCLQKTEGEISENLTAS